MNKMTITKNGEETAFSINYGKGSAALEMAIQESIMNLISLNIQKEEIKIYMPSLVQTFLWSELASSIQSLDPTKVSYSSSGVQRLTEFMGVEVLPGYESNVVVIAWEFGEQYNVQPIRISWNYIKKEEHERGATIQK